MGNDVSRRSFLQGSALTAAAAALGNAIAHGADQSGPGPVSVGMMVNGTMRRLNIEPRMTLAEAIRGPLGLTGTKIACNRGACSACTVWLDGEPVCSCMMLAIEVGARRVTTIEGLAHGDTLHPVQVAFIEHDAVQCGFCTPGMVLSCASLVERTPAPTAEDVKEAISGHLCRCGTYPHVVAATLDAARMRKGSS